MPVATFGRTPRIDSLDILRGVAILGILLISCVAGVVAHIPAGLGVLETVFLALLHGQLAQGTLVAALLGYRTLYYLVPLLLAVLTYLILEKRAKAMRRRDKPA